MKLQPLYDLQQEINRLFIAGSKFAKGDPRLLKHIAVFNKLGEKAPVFKKIATDIEDLTNTDAQQSSEKLIAISTLLYSILYTQGETIEEDKETTQQKAQFDIKELNTDNSYQQLKPVIDALTISYSGRLEILEDAFKQDVFNDFRTFQHLSVALGDKYSELADYVESSIIPKVGKPIIPFILQDFEYEDRTENVRRFRLLNKLGYEKTEEMADHILSKSLPNLQAEVINIKSIDVKNEDLILKLADDKNKTVREAAYLALARLNTEKSLEKLTTILKKNKSKTSLSAIVSAIGKSGFSFHFQEVLNYVIQVYEEFAALDKNTDDKVLYSQLEKFSISIEVLERKDKTEVTDFIKRVLADKQFLKIINSKQNLLSGLMRHIISSILKVINSLGDEKTVSFFEANAEIMANPNWNHQLWINYLTVSKNIYNSSKIYDVFAKPVKQGIIQVQEICEILPDIKYYYYKDENANIDTGKIDIRWLDIFYSVFDNIKKWSYQHRQALILINAMEVPKSKKFDNLLLSSLKKLDPYETTQIFKILVDRNVENCYEEIYTCMVRHQAAIKTTSTHNYFYAFRSLNETNFWSKFPKSYADKFRKLHINDKTEIFETIATEIEIANN